MNKALHRKHPPLLDVLRLFHLLIIGKCAIEGLAVAFVAALFVIGGMSSTNGTLLFVLGQVAINLGVVMLTFPGKRPNAIFLRSFRSDRKDTRIRLRIEAAIGGRFRLVGIRSPQKRAGVWWQAILAPLVALRYAGSPYFEMESGHDWLMRLSSSLATTRLVILDLRDWTEAVGHEIQLCLRAVGSERCALLLPVGDISKTVPSEILAQMHGALQVPLDEGNPEPALALLRQWSSQLPAEPNGVSPEAVAYAKAHSDAAALERTAYWYRNAGRTLIAALGLLAFSTAVVVGVDHFEGGNKMAFKVAGQLGQGGIILLIVTSLVRFWRRRIVYFHEPSRQTRKFSLSIFVAPMFVTFCFVAGAALFSRASSAHVIRGTNSDYQITLPFAWGYARDKDVFDLVAVTSAASRPAMLMIAASKREGLTTDEMVASFRKTSILQLRDSAVTKIAGMDWRTLEGVDPTDEEWEVWRIFFIAREKDAFVLFVHAMPITWKMDEQALMKMVHTFTFPAP